MTLLALTAAKGAPGVSTWCAALLAAWPAVTGRGLVLVDADVSGGGPLSRFQRLGLGDNRGLLGWSAAGGRSSLESQLFRVGDDDARWLLTGVPDVAAAPAVARSWPRLVDALGELTDGRDLDVVVDLGRWGARHEASAILACADRVAVVLRSDFESLSLTQGLCSALGHDRPDPPVALLVGERSPYTSHEVADALGVDVAGVAPQDPRAARRLTDPAAVARGESRSPIVRSARGAVPALVEDRSHV